MTPKLKFGKPEVTVLQGRVSASFANPAYLEQQCKTPISYMRDKEASAATCLAMEHAGQSYDQSTVSFFVKVAKLCQIS